MRENALLKVKSQVILFSITAVLLGCGRLNHPSDQELIDNWRAHKSEFQQLLQMFIADKGLGRVAPDFTRPENPINVGVTQERLKAYRNLFNTLGLSAGVEGYDEKETIWFHASTQGLAVSGSSKGYAYLSKKPVLLVENLEKYWSTDGKSFTAFKLIEGNWYLYFDYED